MTNSATFVAYIDESGDEGFKFGAGSSEWFVLAAVVLRRTDELKQVKLVDEVRARLNQDRKPERRIPDKKPLHFRDLRHEQRKFYAARLAQADLRTVCVLIHKADLAASESFTAKRGLYFYAMRHLVELISWYCSTHKPGDDSGDGSVNLVLSNRATLAGATLRRSMEYLEKNQVRLSYCMAPGVIRPEQIATYNPGQRRGLQLADAVATSYYYAVEPSAYGFTEDAYARLLLPRAYHNKGTLYGYGIKILPHEVEKQMRTGTFLPKWKV